MRIIPLCARLAPMALLLGAALPASAGPGGHPAPHVHGAAELRISVDGAQLEVQFESPLENLVRFERAPRNDKEREAIRTMVTQLRNVPGLFTPTAAAACTPADVRLASPAIPAQLLGEPAPAGSDSKPAGDHADLAATYRFRCAAPERLNGLETRLLKAFPGVHKLQVPVAAPRGQSSTVLTPGRAAGQW